MASIWQKLGLGHALHEPSAFEQAPEWRQKRLSSKQVASKIPNGSHVYIGSTGATANKTLNNLVVHGKGLLDINIIQFIPGGELPHLEEDQRRFRTTSLFAFERTAEVVQRGIADYNPISSGRIHRLIKERRLPIDVALVKVTPPDAQGYCSLGIGVDMTLEAVENAPIVIAEVCDHMPWTSGNSVIHTSEIDWWTQHSAPLPTSSEMFTSWHKPRLPKDVIEGIARNVLFEIPDGATLKLDLNAAIYALVPYLSEKKDLGLHTDLLTDELAKLISKGVINNRKKNVNTGKAIVSHATGSQRLYEFVHQNPNIEFHTAYTVNRLDFMARNDKLISLVGALKVDLSGQVAVDTVGGRIYSGVGSSDDSIRGAGYSNGGKPLVILPSLSPRGSSNIVFALPEGTGVVVTRQDVHYVISEYGTAYLFGKSIRERCLALIDIAHPNFREQLLEQAKNSFYIHSQQPGHSFKSTYPLHWEALHTTRSGKEVLVRPIKAVDEDHLRDFFHKLSDQNVYMRYFTQLRSLPQKILKRFSDIDYSKDMALVILSPPQTAQHEIVGIGQWILDTEDHVPEIAFQIRDDWQGEGLGNYLLTRLIEMARAFQIQRLKADVLEDNLAMHKVFEASGLTFKRSHAFGVYTYRFDLHQA